MKSIKTLERLQSLHKLIDRENTGTPLELADKLNVSERLTYNLIEQLKEFNADIGYSRKSKTYFYLKNFELNVTISVHVISNNEITKIFAGAVFFSENHSLQGFCSDQKYI
jgi:transcriptional antiterminator